MKAFRPDVLVTQLGIDGYHSDPLTHLMLTSQGYIQAVSELAGMGLPWLALGGGGYDLSAVARCWALAYGTMIGQEWPDEIPRGYRERHGLSVLRDSQEPTVDKSVRAKARQFAEESVRRVKELVFPYHGMDS